MEVVRLAAIRDFQDPHGEFRDESGGDDDTGAASRIIAIKHQGYLSEVLLEKNLLSLRKGAPHERNDAWEPSLMYVETVKEPFNHNNGTTVANGAVQIEEDM